MQDSSWARCTQMEGHWRKKKKKKKFHEIEKEIYKYFMTKL
jgi:hypothetical protein